MWQILTPATFGGEQNSDNIQGDVETWSLQRWEWVNRLRKLLIGSLTLGTNKTDRDEPSSIHSREGHQKHCLVVLILLSCPLGVHLDAAADGIQFDIPGAKVIRQGKTETIKKHRPLLDCNPPLLTSQFSQLRQLLETRHKKESPGGINSSQPSQTVDLPTVTGEPARHPEHSLFHPWKT